MSDQSGGGNIAAPPQTPTWPQNPIPIVYSGFTGLNTKASQQGIGDQEMFVCDGFMPLGPNNLRTLYDLGTAIYTAPGVTTIKSFGFGNIGSAPVCIISLSDGRLVQVNTSTLVETQVGAVGTITTFPAAFSQWSNQYIIIVSAQTNGYFLWDGTNLFKSGTVAPQVTIINGGADYTSAPTITTTNIGSQATGNISFAVNPVNNETITLNGVVWTFVTGTPSGNQTKIQGSLEFTIVTLQNNLLASVDPLLTVATYLANTAASPPSLLQITYSTTGVAGNAYTLAASIATPSGATLAGGVNGGGGATFTGTVANGSLITVTVTNPGSGYSVGDELVLTITGGGSDDMAKATATIATTSGVSSILVLNGGGGYTSLAKVVFAGGGASAQAQGAIIGQNGVITQVVVQNPGLGYTSAPTVTIVDVTGSLGSGASLSGVIASGQLSSITMSSFGSGYTTAPTMTILGDGSGAILQAHISGGLLDSMTVVSGGINYTQARIQFNGGNDGAAALATIMPFGVSGTTVETYQSRVWTGNGRTGQYSAPASPADYSAANGAGAFPANESYLRVAYKRFIQSNGFLYLVGDSSINYVSGVSTGGNPVITTFNNLNVDPQIGSPWGNTVQPFGRDIVFANPIGVFVSYGGAVTKVSDQLDGIYATVAEADWPSGFEPSAAVMTIFGIQVYILLMCILDQVSGAQVIKCLMWDGKKWWTSPQTGLTNALAASQEINSVLTGYCSPDRLTIKPMFNTSTSASTMTKYLYSKLWDAPGVFTTKIVREFFALLNANEASLAVQATGYIQFAANPSNLDTITLNGVVWTFVAGAPVGNQTRIQGTKELTIVNLETDLNASAVAGIAVATYLTDTGPPVRLNITYDAAGTAGNAYTLAASVATPSGATLTGGVDAEQIYIAPVTEEGVGNEASFSLTRTGPTIIGPLPAAEPGKLQGVRVRTVTQDIQINSITLIDQNQQSNV